MRKSKTFLLAVGVLACALSLPDIVNAASRLPSILIVLNGHKLVGEGSPYLESGTTMVPFRAIFEALGLSVRWNEASRTVVGTKEDLTIELQINNKKAKLNGQEITISESPVIHEGVTYVPLRLVGEAAGKTVMWDSRALTVHISDSADPIDPVTATNDSVELAHRNSVNKLANWNKYSTVIIDGEWMYFQNYTDRSRLYKSKLDGSNLQKLSNKVSVSYMYLSEDRLLFQSTESTYEDDVIYQIKTDGSDEGILLNENVVDWQVVGDWIYYNSRNVRAQTPFEPTPPGYFKKIHLDGTQETLLSNEVGNFFIKDSFIYYKQVAHESGLNVIVTKSKLEDYGSDPQMLGELDYLDSMDLQVYDNKMYYTTKSPETQLPTLYEKDMSSGAVRTVRSNVKLFTINDRGEIFFIDRSAPTFPFCKMTVDNNQVIVLSDDSVESFYVFDDWIAYYSSFFAPANEDDLDFKRNFNIMKVDGSSQRVLMNVL
ncbi:DUF5050 domain-containing protein [Paenibacillus athensensis]|uniref:stalk domain-containing protein n=1 Tax=Paenibacillus athensensis TaxID=1967502 RepID=UPI001431F9B3|nr:DUF5050 domain-containing protein [Paenibacillus athensensis]MCD1261650.1 DUF5050 domain-containing protein [Paenibacillus athensensis]